MKDITHIKDDVQEGDLVLLVGRGIERGKFFQPEGEERTYVGLVKSKPGEIFFSNGTFERYASELRYIYFPNGEARFCSSGVHNYELVLSGYEVLKRAEEIKRIGRIIE